MKKEKEIKLKKSKKGGMAKLRKRLEELSTAETHPDTIKMLVDSGIMVPKNNKKPSGK